MYRRRLALTTLIVSLSVGSMAAPAAAAPPAEFAGTFTVPSFEVTGFEELSESVNRFTAVSMGVLAGDLTSTTTSTLTCHQVEEVLFTCRGDIVAKNAAGAVVAQGDTRFVCHYKLGTCKGTTRATTTAGEREVTHFESSLITGQGTYVTRRFG